MSELIRKKGVDGLVSVSILPGIEAQRPLAEAGAKLFMIPEFGISADAKKDCFWRKSTLLVSGGSILRFGGANSVHQPPPVNQWEAIRKSVV